METDRRYFLEGMFIIGFLVAAAFFFVWLANTGKSDDVVYRIRFGESVSGLALPSSVAGRDGTRLKYRSGIALRTNSRVARKCPPFPVRCQYNAPDRPRVPARAPSRRGPFATCQVSPSRSCPRADRGGSGLDGSPRHYNRAARPGRPNRPRKAFSLNEIHIGRRSLTRARARPQAVSHPGPPSR